jgi:hypothetical protein
LVLVVSPPRVFSGRVSYWTVCYELLSVSACDDYDRDGPSCHSEMRHARERATRLQWGCNGECVRNFRQKMERIFVAMSVSWVVPRGGIEPSPIQLKIHHFLNGDFPVYLPVDPAPSPRPGGCDSVPPYPSRVRVMHYTKEIISAVCCALIQIGWSWL